MFKFHSIVLHYAHSGHGQAQTHCYSKCVIFFKCFTSINAHTFFLVYSMACGTLCFKKLWQLHSCITLVVTKLRRWNNRHCVVRYIGKCCFNGICKNLCKLFLNTLHPTIFSRLHFGFLYFTSLQYCLLTLQINIRITSQILYMNGNHSY